MDIYKLVENCPCVDYRGMPEGIEYQEFDYSLPEDFKFIKVPFCLGLPKTEDHKRKISLTHKQKGTTPVANGATEAARIYNTGKKQNPNHIKKRAVAQQKKVCVNGVIYNSVGEAAKALGVGAPAISNRIKRGHTAWLISQ